MSINTIESYEIDNKLYVNTKFLCVFFAKSEKQIGRWKKDGLPIAKKPKELTFRGEVFNLKDAQEWVKYNIDKQKSQATQKNKTIELEDITEEEILEQMASMDQRIVKKLILMDSNLKKTVADANKAEEEAQISKLKRLQLEESLIDADDVDKSRYEQAIMHKTMIENQEKIFPIILENKSSDEISKIINEHNNDHMDLLNSQIEQKFKGDSSNYDIFYEILQARRNKAEPNKIIKAIREVK